MTMATEVKVRGTYGYYRQPDGWITVSAMTNTDELQYRRGGWEPLRQYGLFEMATPYMASHPLEPLFMQGGVVELCEDQIRKMGLYIDPPVIPNCRTPLSQDHKRHEGSCMRGAKRVVFPQLAGMTDLGPFPCRFGCGRSNLPTVEARDQHETVMHGPEKSDIRSGEALSVALLKGLGGQPASVVLAPEAVAAGDQTALGAILAKMEAMQRELAELKAGGSSGAVAVAPVPVARHPKEWRRNQTKHTHDRPWNSKHLVAGCPRCQEMRQA